MITYKINSIEDSKSIGMFVDGAMTKSIPFDPANTDYANFKLDLADGVELQDADGNTMTAEEVAEFVATLP